MSDISIPNFRFKKYTSNLVKTKLSKIATFNPKSLLPENFKYIDLESVLGTELVSCREETRETAPSRAQRVAQKGDVFYQLVRPYQKNNYLFDLNENNYVFSTGYAQLRPKVDSAFLLARLQEEGFVNKVIERCTGTSYPAINSKDLSRISITIPEDLEEQSAIGSLFRTLDDLLASYKDNLANYQSLKATMLSKMFPKAGQTVPEIRLDGFERKWEKKKLIDLVSPVSRKVKKPSDPYYRLSIRSHAKGTFKQFVDDPKKIAMDNLFEVKENDLVVNITFAWEHAIAVASKEDDGLLVSHRFPTYVIDKSDKNFINIYIKREEFRQKMDLLSPGGAGRNRVLNVKDFINIQMIVPELEEQQAIGAYFSNLDYLIDAHQEKITQLETLKKKLLQDMFI